MSSLIHMILFPWSPYEPCSPGQGEGSGREAVRIPSTWGILQTVSPPMNGPQEVHCSTWPSGIHMGQQSNPTGMSGKCTHTHKKEAWIFNFTTTSCPLLNSLLCLVCVKLWGGGTTFKSQRRVKLKTRWFFFPFCPTNWLCTLSYCFSWLRGCWTHSK